MEVGGNGSGCGRCLEVCCWALLFHHSHLKGDGSFFSGPPGSPLEPPRKKPPDLRLFLSPPCLHHGCCAADAVSLRPFGPPCEPLTPSSHQDQDLSGSNP